MRVSVALSTPATIIVRMDALLGAVVLAGSAGLVAATAFEFRLRLPGDHVDRLFVAAGAGLGVGALLVQQGVSPVEWVLVPVALGALFPLHARLLFAGDGPLRVKGDWDLAGAYPVPNSRERTLDQIVEGTEEPQPPEPEAGEAFVETPPQTQPVAPSQPFPRTQGVLPSPRPGSGFSTRRERRAQVRRTRVVVRHVGPVSVLKLSLIFYFCVWLIVFFGLLIAFGIASSLGVVDKTAEFWGKLFSDAGANFKISGDWIFTRLFLVGSMMVVVAAVLNLIVTFLYNLISDVVGGLEVTLSEKR
jgi:transmembrane protein DUF3566